MNEAGTAGLGTTERRLPPAAGADQMADLAKAAGNLTQALTRRDDIVPPDELLGRFTLGMPQMKAGLRENSIERREALLYLDMANQFQEWADAVERASIQLRSNLLAALALDPKSSRRKALVHYFADWFHGLSVYTEAKLDQNGEAEAVNPGIDPRGMERAKSVFIHAASPILESEFYAPSRKLLFRYGQEAQLCLDRFDRSREVTLELKRALSELEESQAFAPRTAAYLDYIDTMHFSEFEHLVADLLDRDGYRVTQRGGKAGDHGMDVIALGELGQPVVVQVKHSEGGNGKVDEGVIRDIAGASRVMHPSSIAMVVTNRHITQPARDWAARENAFVHLVDRKKLQRWAEDGLPLAAVLEDGR
ncbi:restriction endonuclease [Kitasatospora acidiphila]|uniref:Restriction endonuclease n=1 Tax=Kitasatospora acidiphila TaxID=2567942 RepID=A0A540VYT0_9ACTN|nr:restriction endonuclease [Kitasatospora acidiphila]TQF01926.1 restriction endonuclease [Kitasatospora acidiphila]